MSFEVKLDPKIAIERIEKFASKYYIISSKSFDYYKSGNQTIYRKIFAIVIRISHLLNAIRYLISSFNKNQNIKALLCDETYLLGHHFLMSVMMLIASFSVFFIKSVINYQELNKKLFVIDFLYSFKYKRLPLSLNPKHNRHLILHTNLLTKYLMNQTFMALVIIIIIERIIISIVAYLDPNSGFSLFATILWYISMVWLTVQFCAIPTVGFVIWFMTIQYLKYKFNEINDKIIECNKIANYGISMKAIKEHQILTKLTKDFNEFFKYILFVCYRFT